MDAEADRDRSRPFELASRDCDAEQDFADQEMCEVLHREIRRILPLLHNVLMLRDVQELPMTDVAGQLNITGAAAKSRSLRARHELRERLLLHGGSKERRHSSHGLTLLFLIG